MIRKIYSLTKRIQRKIFLAGIEDTWLKKAWLLHYQYPEEIIPDKKSVHLKRLGLTIERGSFEFVLDSYHLLRNIVQNLSAVFTVDQEKFLVQFENIKLNPTTAEEFFIIEEIYNKGTYAFDIDEPVVVIDVGMNVGNASLFFASRSFVRKVYSFEPFTPTFRQATANLELNPFLRNKIVTANYGLGNKEHDLVVDYDYGNKGQVGIHGTSYIRSALNKVEKQTISIKKASDELNRILSQHQDTPIVLKLDCEGSEYPILQDLFSEKILSRMKVVLIEWHERGPEPLLELLRKSGFISFYQQTSNVVGMIYAVK